MKGVWHYRDKDGRRCEEELDARQCALDSTLVRSFESVAGTVAEGKHPDAEAVAGLFAATELLPPRRAEHWLKEFARVGLKAPPPKKAKVSESEDKGGTK